VQTHAVRVSGESLIESDWPTDGVAMPRHILLTKIAILDELLEAHSAALGHDFTAYRNHTYRVVNLCAAQFAASSEQLEKMAIAAAFHDMGIWTDGTFDYLPPSVRLANAYLAACGRSDWTPEIAEMILEHHKLLPYRSGEPSLVERFRRADWIDVTRGLLTFDLSRSLVAEILCAWPSAGFHWKLVQLELERLRTHPWNPLPMVKL
jgi:hypothetical protein